MPAPAVEAELERVAQELRRRVRLPGFRKGKVPFEVVRQRFREDIEREAVERLVPRYWRQAQAEARLEPLLPPRVENVDYKPGLPLVFRATVETRPEIELGELGGFFLPQPAIEVGDAEVDSALAELRRRAARWVPVERPAAAGDLVEGDLAEIPLGAEAGTATGAGQRVAFEVGDPTVWEELWRAAPGVSAGEAFEFNRVDGEGEAMRNRRFRLAVAAVRERELPPLDDELAHRLGKFADLAALTEDVRQSLLAAKRREARRLRERALLDQLRERHPVPLPAGVVEHEVEHLLQDYADGLRLQGVDPQRASIDWRAAAAELKPQAERRVHARLLLDAAAERLGVAASEEELEATLAALGRAQGKSAQAARQALDRSGRLAELKAQLRRDKTLRRLLGETGEAAGPPPTEAAEAAGEE